MTFHRVASSRRTVETLFAVVTLARNLTCCEDIRALSAMIADQSRDDLEELALVLAVILGRTSDGDILQKCALEIAEQPAVEVVIL